MSCDKSQARTSRVCSAKLIGELEVWDSIVVITVLIDDDFDDPLEDFGWRKEKYL